MKLFPQELEEYTTVIQVLKHLKNHELFIPSNYIEFERKDCKGQGAIAEVFACRIKGERQKYAVKVFRMIHLDTEIKNSKIETFINEAEILQELQELKSPFILKYKGFSFNIYGNNIQYMIIEELCENNLEKFIEYRVQNNIEVTFDEILKFMWQLFTIFSQCHKKNIVHRDLKPGNILIKDLNKLEIKLGDFSEAGKKEYGDNTLDTINSVRGNLSYCSPQMLFATNGEEKVIYNAYKNDLYGIGMLTLQFALDNQLQRNDRRKEYEKNPNEYQGHFLGPCHFFWEKSLLDVENYLVSRKYKVTLVEKFLSILKQCIAYREEDRPDFCNVLQILEDTFPLVAFYKRQFQRKISSEDDTIPYNINNVKCLKEKEQENNQLEKEISQLYFEDNTFIQQEELRENQSALSVSYIQKGEEEQGQEQSQIKEDFSNKEINWFQTYNQTNNDENNNKFNNEIESTKEVSIQCQIEKDEKQKYRETHQELNRRMRIQEEELFETLWRIKNICKLILFLILITYGILLFIIQNDIVFFSYIVHNSSFQPEERTENNIRGYYWINYMCFFCFFIYSYLVQHIQLSSNFVKEDMFLTQIFAFIFFFAFSMSLFCYFLLMNSDLYDLIYDSEQNSIVVPFKGSGKDVCKVYECSKEVEELDTIDNFYETGDIDEKVVKKIQQNLLEYGYQNFGWKGGFVGGVHYFFITIQIYFIQVFLCQFIFQQSYFFKQIREQRELK